MKIDLGSKQMAPTKLDENKPYYPTITIRKKETSKYSPGDSFSGSVEGSVKEIRKTEDGEHECVVELHSIEMGKSKKADTSKSGAEAFDSMMKEEMGRSSKKKSKKEDDYEEEE